jgi:hypothetical protein
MLNKDGRKIHNLTLKVVTIVNLEYLRCQLCERSGHISYSAVIRKRLGYETFFFIENKKTFNIVEVMTFHVMNGKYYSLMM